MTSTESKDLMLVILSLFSAFQVFACLENLVLLRGQAPSGSVLKPTFPRLVRELFPFVFQDRAFQALLIFALVVNVLVTLMASFPQWFFDSRLIALQGFFLLMQLIRFRGSLNGGSDFFALHLQIGFLIGFLIPAEPAAKAGLAYIAATTALSFFRAGFYKALQKKWWTGEAMAELLKSSPFAEISMRSWELSRLQIISWLTVIFQLSFPVVFILPETGMAVYFALGFGMHLANWRILGLHRFLLYWPLGYIAIYAMNLEVLRFVN